MQPNQPFFSGDVAGILRVLIVIVLPIVLSILGGVWKIMQGPIQSKLDSQARDINEVGRKVGDLGMRFERNDAETNLLRGRVASMEFESKYLRESMAEIRASLAEVRETSIDNRTAIVGKFEEVMEKMRNDFRTLSDKVLIMAAKADERDTIHQAIEKAVKRA